MSTQRGLLKGPKGSNHHTSVIDDAIVIIETAKITPEVTKVRPALISGKGSRKRRLKFFPLDAGLKVVVYGTNCQQDVYVYTPSPEIVERKLCDAWTKRFGD